MSKNSGGTATPNRKWRKGKKKKKKRKSRFSILLDPNNHRIYQTPLASIDIHQAPNILTRIIFLSQLKFQSPKVLFLTTFLAPEIH